MSARRPHKLWRWSFGTNRDDTRCRVVPRRPSLARSSPQPSSVGGDEFERQNPNPWRIVGWRQLDSRDRAGAHPIAIRPEDQPGNDMPDSPHARPARTPANRSIFSACRAIVLGAALFSGACHDLGPRKFNLAGTVALQDSWANRLDDFSGVEVALDGHAASTFTDKAGAWHIDKVPSGTHDITYTKTAFGTVRIARLAVNELATTVPDVTMALTPSQQAIIDSIYMRTSTTPAGTDVFFRIDGHLSAPPPDSAKVVSVVAFLGKTAGVSPDTTSFERSNTFTDRTGKLSSFFVIFSADELVKAFGTGTQVFATAYVNGAACSCTPDPREAGAAKPVFSGTGPRGNVIELTIP